MQRLAFALVLIVVAAGCVKSDPAAPGIPLPDDAQLADVIPQDHDHADRAAHEGSLNLDLIAHIKPWGDGSEYGLGTVNEFAVRGNHVYVSRSNPEGGFAIINITDPEVPQVVGDFRSEGGADIEVSEDGAYVFLMTQRTVPGTQTPDNPTARTPRGVYVVDVRDKTAPTLASFFPLPTNGPHTAFYHKAADGRELVALQTYDLVALPTGQGIEAVNPLTQRVLLTQFTRDGVAPRLETQGSYQYTVIPQSGVLVFPHDSFIETHPVTGKLLMSLAYWDGGMRIVDITDLANPVEVSSFTSFSPTALIAMHDVKTFPTLQNGRHITVVAPEIVTAPEAGQMTFLDTTDPRGPKQLGYWSVPGDLVVDAPFLFSPHVFDLTADGFATIGHNHAGVWLIDARDVAAPKTVGYYFPTAERPDYVGTQPSVWGARFHQGYVLATDGPTGLYILAPPAGLLADDTDKDTIPGSAAAGLGTSIKQRFQSK